MTERLIWYQLCVHVTFRVVSGRLQWLSNLISVTTPFYNVLDVCRLTTATSFIFAMFTTYTHDNFRYTRCTNMARIQVVLRSPYPVYYVACYTNE